MVFLCCVTETSHAVWVNVGPRSFTRLCPNHIGGDREYAGHGPEVSASASLAVDSTGQALQVNFFMHQIETKSDWSEAQLERSFRLYTAPFGQRITFIWNATYSEIFYVDTNHALDRFFPADNLIQEFAIIGDTRGNDIGNCTADDAYLNAFLESLWVWVE
jgi:hypothetical protein